MSLHHTILSRTLENGLTILGVPVPGTEAVTTFVTVASGARNESDEQQGLAHFAEHMFFKGGARYTSTKQISEALDGVGGEFNAFTGHESTSYYTKTAAEHAVLGMDILSDMLLHPRFPAEELERERGVIIEEINMYNDMPMRQVEMVAQKLLFGDTPLGRSILGTKESVSAFSPDDFFRYHGDRYVAARSVVVIAGAVTEVLMEEAAQRFSGMPTGEVYSPVPAVLQTDALVNLETRESEQTHLVITFPGLPQGHPKRAALLVLSTLLGGSMSSRLFLRVREEQGLCYYVRSGVDSYTDIGLVTISAGVDNKRFGNAVQAIIKELHDLAAGGATDEEVERAKQNRLGRTALSMEDGEQVANYYSEQFVLEGSTRTPAERLAEIERVTTADIHALAAELIQANEFRLAAVGPQSDVAAVEQWLRG
jgi:predicted Zn-dependent peptidase